jgi:hypothetical protein
LAACSTTRNRRWELCLHGNSGAGIGLGHFEEGVPAFTEIESNLQID